MTSAVPLPRKAIIALGFGSTTALEGAAALPYEALAERLPAGARQGIQRAVEEALSAGLMELVFITPEGGSLTAGDGQARELIFSRDPGAQTLAEALRAARPLIGSGPFVVLAPDSLPLERSDTIRRLLAAYRQRGGNLAVVADEEFLRQEGTFAAIASGGGPYLLQSEVLDALDTGTGLAEALLDMAEAWPVTAVPLSGQGAEVPVGAITEAAD